MSSVVQSGHSSAIATSTETWRDDCARREADLERDGRPRKRVGRETKRAVRASVARSRSARARSGRTEQFLAVPLEKLACRPRSLVGGQLDRLTLERVV